MDELLRGVVPRESPASWGDAGRRARAWPRSGPRPWRPAATRPPVTPAGATCTAASVRAATTCDDQFCQVYGGAATVSATRRRHHAHRHPNTDQAVAETAGEVRITASGAVARTEFSSSTGGWTAGGTFPAVVDQGDAVVEQPEPQLDHQRGPLQRSRAPTSLGTLTGIQVLDRNDLGDMGGRVVHDPAHRHEPRRSTSAGNQLRSALRPEVRLVRHHGAAAARGPRPVDRRRRARRRPGARRAPSPTSPADSPHRARHRLRGVAQDRRAAPAPASSPQPAS